MTVKTSEKKEPKERDRACSILLLFLRIVSVGVTNPGLLLMFVSIRIMFLESSICTLLAQAMTQFTSADFMCSDH
jgi:hypothetical protein